MKQLSSRTMKLSSNKTIRYFTISLFLSFILTSGFYKLFFKVNPIFAESATSITKNTDTHFSAGTASSTAVSGTGASAVVQLSGSAGPDGTVYRKAVALTNSSGGTLTDYQVLIDEGEVGYWKMDETSGQSAADSSGLANTGTATGTTIVAGQYGSARSLNGSSDYIRVEDNSSLDFGTGNFTATGWIYVNSSGLVANNEYGL